MPFTYRHPPTFPAHPPEVRRMPRLPQARNGRCNSISPAVYMTLVARPLNAWPLCCGGRLADAEEEENSCHHGTIPSPPLPARPAFSCLFHSSGGATCGYAATPAGWDHGTFQPRGLPVVCLGGALLPSPPSSTASPTSSTGLPQGATTPPTHAVPCHLAFLPPFGTSTTSTAILPLASPACAFPNLHLLWGGGGGT